jgi:hypothetical protein
VPAENAFARITIEGSKVKVDPLPTLANNGANIQHGKIIEFKVTLTAGVGVNSHIKE